MELLPLLFFSIGGILSFNSFNYSIGFSIIQLLWSIFLFLNFQKNIEFQFIYYWLGLDSTALGFLILFNLLYPLLFIYNYKNSDNPRLSQILIHITQFLTTLLLISINILIFFISFELLLIPIIYILYYYGSRNKKLLAIKFLIIYTLIGSFLILLGFIFIYIKLETWNYLIILDKVWMLADIQNTLWFLFFLGFGVKVPIYIFHIWLPIVHTEGNAIGSIILSSILLKLGYLGILRFNLGLCPQACLDWTPLVIIISILGIIYAVIAALSTLDLKQVIAYSSIIHMNMGNLGLFSNTLIGISCSFNYNITHGLVSAGLFLLAGFLYDRYKTRIIYYYKGLVLILPIFTSILFIIILSNISFPFTSGFLIEILLFITLFQINPILSLISMTIMFLLPVYFLIVYQRIAYSNISSYINYATQDLNFKEL